MRFDTFEQIVNPAKVHDYRLRGQVPFRFVFHTDEVPGANIRALAATHPNPPHFWVDPAKQIALQIVDTDLAARALHHPHGVETNHACAIQTEMAGKAATTHQWPEEWLRWLAETFAPVWAHHGINTARTLPTFGADHAYGEHAQSRMKDSEWLAFDGICAHQHVPVNDHWDAGRLDLARIAAHLTQEDDMTDDQLERLIAAQEANTDRIIEKLGGLGSQQVTTNKWLERIHNSFKGIGEDVKMIRDELRKRT